ncbi:PIG-L family deacetylase [Pseudomonas phytophila]|uniref:PIG-L family deacetylase n=1 Tax=Pseudomonas phytophila TaxID=2867264 RepID=A0ABY6FGE0_9PSED|nr:PIG-L family deacetylase [Pseudomonas phytophila]UXZ96983.1 PIG-L family deacetylase [Pseudomonas phytophila]
MVGRKDELLKRHRRRKRYLTLVAVAVLVLLAIFVAWWLLPLLVLAGWLVHEAWFSDHLFYDPASDYLYEFPSDVRRLDVEIQQGRLQLATAGPLGSTDTVLLELHLKSTWLGRWLDPYVKVGNDRQDFERGTAGKRYLNLSGQAGVLANEGLYMALRRCRAVGSLTLYVMSNPDYSAQSLLVLAPHADDAELAAFGLYSRTPEAAILTLTQGEIEADSYRRFGLDASQAAVLKGRLRTWDSLAVPLWGGVAQSRCVQLGYYCLRLADMQEQPSVPFGSRESGESDIRAWRQASTFSLPSEADGLPTWNNLVADIVRVLEYFKPSVVVTPHLQLDPHRDHIAATQALLQAIEVSAWRPSTLLLYANHLHDNDRWPMGPAGYGVALPPAIARMKPLRACSILLDDSQRLDKAMALAMQHDLQDPLPPKKRVRRWIQQLLAGRRWPNTGENEFFRKAVRRHELFWVLDVEPRSSANKV